MESGHASIGEVIGILQGEFPDVTISKIRFLEAQGLLDPERTPSGYRKFSDADVECIRWILTQQRDHFLPLKIIKERLASGDMTTGAADGVLPFSREVPASATSTGTAVPDVVRLDLERDERARPASAGVDTPLADADPVNLVALAEEGERERHPTVHVKGDPTPEPSILAEVRASGAQFSLEDLARASGLSLRELGELERFGLITTRSIGEVTYYDDEALLVARLAAGFHRHGIETRHLRMYKVGAEREAALFGQLITPLLRKRTAEAREQAVGVLEDLAELADDLRAAMVRSVLREYLGSD